MLVLAVRCRPVEIDRGATVLFREGVSVFIIATLLVALDPAKVCLVFGSGCDQ